MVEVVNGYVCLTGCDAATAKRGADPRNPTRDPVKQELLDRANPIKAAEADRAAALKRGETGDSTRPDAPGVSLAALPPGLGERLDVVA